MIDWRCKGKGLGCSQSWNSKSDFAETKRKGFKRCCFKHQSKRVEFYIKDLIGSQVIYLPGIYSLFSGRHVFYPRVSSRRRFEGSFRRRFSQHEATYSRHSQQAVISETIYSFVLRLKIRCLLVKKIRTCSKYYTVIYLPLQRPLLPPKSKIKSMKLFN